MHLNHAMLEALAALPLSTPREQKAFAAAKRGKATLDSVEHVVLEDDDH